MQPSKDLFQLIKALNKAEKRHFKLVATQYATNSNYVKLFDAIDKQVVYDESKLKRKFRNETFAKKLAATKYLLHELILKSMRGLYEGKSVDTSLRALLGSVEVLYNKGLYAQSRKVLNRAMKLADRYEKTFWAYDILKWRKRLFSYTAPGKLSKEMESLLEADHKATENLHNETTFVELMDKVNFLKISRLPKEKMVQQFQETLDHPLMECVDRALTFKAKVHFYLIKSSAEQVKGNVKGAFDILEEMIAFWNAYEDYIPSYATLYVQCMSEYLLCGFQIRSDFNYEQLLVRLQQVPQVVAEQSKKQTTVVQILDFIACISTDKLLDCDCQVNQLLDTLKESERLLDYNWLITAYYYIGIYYFMKNNHDEALTWLKKIEQYSKLPMCSNIQEFCQLLELVAHYELENYTFVEYRLRTVYRQLKQRRQLNTIEKLLLKYIKKLIFTNDSAVTTGLFQQFQAQITSEQDSPQIPPMGNRVIQRWAVANC